MFTYGDYLHLKSINLQFMHNLQLCFHFTLRQILFLNQKINIIYALQVYIQVFLLHLPLLKCELKISKTQ